MMNSRSLLLAIVIGSLGSFLGQSEAAAAKPLDFEAQIAPLLIKRCVECHQGSEPAGNLSLTTQAGFLKGGDSGEVIDFEAPDESFFLTRIIEGEMPPAKKGQSQKLAAEEIALLKNWVASGAKWPAERTLDLFERTTEIRGGRDWWSLQPIHRPKVPQVRTAETVKNPIDAFVLARLEQNQIVPAPTADKRTMLRRLYFDLTGLPPTQAEIEAFVADNSPQAWEKVVDAQLSSPQYGERWARYWLDLVRYADTSGYERDQEKPFAWKYRDWVVNAFNQDLPYDRFVIEQLAGDEIADRSEDSVIATGFLRLGTWNDEPNEPLDYQYERLEDLVHTTSTAFLGLTVKCARCHSHKFDAITQEDYYRMASTFWAGPIAPADRKFLGGPDPQKLGFPEVLGWTDLGSSPPPLHLLKNGEREHPLQEVVPASLSTIPKLERRFDPPTKDSPTSHRRLQLANWITHKDNPLTARVLVNRLWQHHFGEGIVRTPNNFGFLADPPTHPQLLDWLATEFMSGGWRIKRLHKLILMSRTWQQASLHPRFAEYQKRDAGNRLWWRAKRRRLDAEALRDSMLAATGELDLTMGGPGIRLSISDEALEGLSMKSAAWQASPLSDQLRRSLYAYSKRGLLPPMMTTFDFCDTTQPCGQRDSTTVPTQALTMLNNRFTHERSEALARTISQQKNAPSVQVEQLWSKVYARDPSREETAAALRYLGVQSNRIEQALERQEKQNEPKEEIDPQRLEDSRLLHLRADRGMTLDTDGRVSVWEDQTTHGHHAQQSMVAQRPRLLTSGYAGQPVVMFDGQGQFMHLQGELLKEQHCTIVAVVHDRASEGHREILSNWNGEAGNAGTSLFLGMTAENTVRFSDAFPSAGQIVDRSKPFVIIAINGPDGSAVFVNGRQLSARNSPLPARNLSTRWVIGRQGTLNGEFWNGGIAELSVYSRALLDYERAALEASASKRYGVSLSPEETAESLSPKVLALASLAHVLLNSNEFLYVD